MRRAEAIARLRAHASTANARLDPLWRVASLAVTDRRWAVPLSALALGFGLFIGVAVGPGSQGSLANTVSQILVPGSDDEAQDPAPSSGGRGGGAPGGGGGGSASSTSPATETSSPAPAAPVPLPPPASPPPSGGGDDGGRRGDGDKKPEPEPETLTGTVIHTNPAAESYALVSEGLVSAIHADQLPEPGTELAVPYRQLANGTYAEDGKREESGTRESVEFAGVVTHVRADLEDPGYTVSRRGMSAFVHVDPDPAGGLPELPALGDFAKVDAAIEEPPVAVVDPGQDANAGAAEATQPSQTCVRDAAVGPPAEPALDAVLRQEAIEVDPEPFTYSYFAGIVQAVCPATGELVVSADDVRESGEDIVFSVPEEFDLSELQPDTSIVATATIEAQGTLLLEGLASDDGERAADDPGLAQGDLASR